jgi:hypothetical protein
MHNREDCVCGKVTVNDFLHDRLSLWVNTVKSQPFSSALRPVTSCVGMTLLTC